MKKMLLSLMVFSVLIAQNVHAAIYTDMSTAIQGHITEAISVIGAVIGAALTIFALFWGIRKIKKAANAGA